MKSAHDVSVFISKRFRDCPHKNDINFMRFHFDQLSRAKTDAFFAKNTERFESKRHLLDGAYSNIVEFVILVAPVFFPCKNSTTHADASVFPPNKTCCAPSWRKLNEMTRVKLIISSSYNYSTGETHRVRDRQRSCKRVERKRGLTFLFISHPFSTPENNDLIG